MNARSSLFIGVVLVLSSLAGAQYLSNKCCRDTLTSPCNFTTCVLIDGHYFHVTNPLNVKVCQTMTNPFLLAACDDNRPEVSLKQDCANGYVYGTLEECANDRNGNWYAIKFPGCTDSCN